MNDLKLSPRHFRALMAVAFHDRFGRNGQGCWVGRKQLAKEAGCDETNFSHALSDLRLFGYIKSEEHPLSRRMKVHRVIYDTAERCEAQHLSTDVRCETRHPSEENRCQKTPEQVLSESAKTLNGADNSSVNILIDNTDIKDLRRDCAEATTVEEARADNRECRIISLGCRSLSVRSGLNHSSSRSLRVSQAFQYCR
jgi:DNA-binding MarR family transcriptional regulator